MDTLELVVITFAALSHLGFLILEMFFWTRPLGLKIFRQSATQSKSSAVLAANQGLYNGFLVAGLAWSLLQPDPGFSHQLRIFFLSCVLLAGIYGAISFSRRLLLVQALPALIGLVLVLV